ncbi:hypothetical protein [Sphingomonas sp. BAUL-RG-20F-R05-02]|uniref:hypothetical protein n=1 Tax=Sphingomonas sp. BAUL-RG-20F-R05-02 TaxID=2914830 RepID=UPI001F583798|nr:hypothetical protein [Sphingomonas sp. BAUL-RG-20F-R05-02]
MSKAKSFVEKATFDALSEAITGATVWQDAPENAPGDVVIIGDMKSFGLGAKGNTDDRRVSISIVTIVEAEERAPLLALQEQIETALDGAEIEVNGWTLAFGFEDDDAVLSEDGATYTGITSFGVQVFAP